MYDTKPYSRLFKYCKQSFECVAPMHGRLTLYVRRSLHYATIQDRLHFGYISQKKEIASITTVVKRNKMSEDNAKASSRDEKTRPKQNSRDGQNRGPYIPPSKRRGKNQGGRGNAARGAPKQSNNNNTPQDHKGAPKPKTHTKNNKPHNRRNNGGHQRLRVYSFSDNDSEHGEKRNRGFWQMHNDCKALRYKVHKPQADCSKLLKMVQHHDDAVDELAAVKLENGKIDALVVVPDTKQKFIYVCKDTSLAVFEEDPFRAEKKLRDEIFAKGRIIDTAGFKLSCASCLLLDHEPNGFCLIASSTRSLIDIVRDKSRSNRREKEYSGIDLHQDHAHFVATLPSSALRNLQRSKTRAQRGQAVDEILGHLSSQGVEVGQSEEFKGSIEVGHHLSSVLALTARSKDEEFWFVMGFDDHESLELDLPGGKRHLGETALEGAIRETEEEASLVWDDLWVKTVLQAKKFAERGNRYFILNPPESFVADNRLDDL